MPTMTPQILRSVDFTEIKKKKMDILKTKNFFFKYKNSIITHLGRSLWQKTVL